jgi:hypothetical protein
VKSLEIRQSLLDSHFEKINLKTMEKFDELQRLFVILHKRIKAQKKLLQHLDEQKELLVFILLQLFFLFILFQNTHTSLTHSLIL